MRLVGCLWATFLQFWSFHKGWKIHNISWEYQLPWENIWAQFTIYHYHCTKYLYLKKCYESASFPSSMPFLGLFTKWSSSRKVPYGIINCKLMCLSSCCYCCCIHNKYFEEKAGDNATLEKRPSLLDKTNGSLRTSSSWSTKLCSNVVLKVQGESSDFLKEQTKITHSLNCLRCFVCISHLIAHY